MCVYICTYISVTTCHYTYKIFSLSLLYLHEKFAFYKRHWWPPNDQLSLNAWDYKQLDIVFNGQAMDHPCQIFGFVHYIHTTSWPETAKTLRLFLACQSVNGDLAKYRHINHNDLARKLFRKTPEMVDRFLPKVIKSFSDYLTLAFILVPS